MSLCTDRITKDMNERGYNLVKLPRVGIEPMDVLGRDGDNLEKLGSISEVWTSRSAPPVMSAPAPAAGITGSKSSDLDIGIGLKLLANALAGLGAGMSLPSLSSAFKSAKKVQFTFQNVESTSVSPFALGKFLADGSLDASNPFVNQYFGNDETREYIIFDVLKSDSISVSAKSDSGASVDADIGFLSGAVSANVKAQAGFQGSSEITFTGSVKVTFAFKLFEVAFVNGKWIPQGVSANGDMSFPVAGDEGQAFSPTGVLLNPSRFLKLSP